MQASLIAQKHLYMADINGRALDDGKVFFGEAGKDPEFYPISIFYDEELTQPAMQPVRTKGGFMSNGGDMIEVYANVTEYSVKVLDKQGRKILYEGRISRLVSAAGIETKLSYDGSVYRTQTDKNSDIINAKDFGVVPNGVDNNTVNLQKAVDKGGVLHCTSGIYVLDSILITKDTTFICDSDVVFKRADNSVTRGSFWDVGRGTFEVQKQGLNIAFIGAPTFDSNSQNQIGRYQEPTHVAIKVQPPSIPTVSTKDTNLYFDRCKFVNGLIGYVMLRGDDSNRRYLTKATFDNCVFSDCIMGTGRGDPLAIAALGWQPDYIVAMDYVHVITNNLTMYNSKIPSLGEYAPVGIRGTFFGSDYNTSGKASVWLNGITVLKGLGRSGKLYNNASDYLINNGIGAIDMYGNTELLHVDSVYATDNYNVTIRAKASINNFTVNTAVLHNCHRGIQVSPSSTGACEAIVNIGSVTSYGGTIPQLEFLGSSNDDKIVSTTINSYHQSGVLTNPEDLNHRTNGALALGNTVKATVTTVDMSSSPTAGITVKNVDDTLINSSTIRNTLKQGIVWDSVGRLTINNPDISNTGEAGISCQESNEKGVFTLRGGTSKNLKDYAVLMLSQNIEGIIDSHSTSDISEYSRGFYIAPNSKCVITNNRVGTGVTTPLITTGAIIHETGNSWNGRVRYGSLYLTTIVSAKVGDIMYNSEPKVGHPLGWVCITAGNPGDWREFNVIS